MRVVVGLAVISLVIGCTSEPDDGNGADSGFQLFTTDGKSTDYATFFNADPGASSGPDLAVYDPGDTADPGVAPTDHGVADSAPTDSGPKPDLGCKPKCDNKKCGPDGCGSVCGTCAAKEVCANGTCSVDPTLGCEGLALPENWTGKFEGSVSFALLGFIPIPAGTHGDLAFTIKCFNSKLIVSGKMTGEASKNPFTLDMVGTYDPKSKKLDIALKNGDVKLWGGVIEYKFEGTCPATLGANNVFDGTWEIKSTDAIVIGQAGQAVPLTGNGTWTATGK